MQKLLFHCVFQSHRCVQSTVSLNFCWRQGSYALRRFIGYSWIYEGRMSPALNGSSVIWHFKHSNAIEIRNRITFLHGTTTQNMNCHVPNCSLLTMPFGNIIGSVPAKRVEVDGCHLNTWCRKSWVCTRSFLSSFAYLVVFLSTTQTCLKHCSTELSMELIHV